MELKRIGKYELEECLGGGMSQVYRARDTVMGRTVAVKILKSAAAADPDAKARFLREAQLAGSIAHENIMSVYDFGEDQGRPYMVMEFLRGQDLATVIKTGAAGDLRNRLQIAIQSCKALDFIHAQKIVHRDVKPENIHVNATGTVKLMDFGIAKTRDLSITQPGFTLGTPSYMAPEQVMGRDVTHLSDVYSFGILLYELFSGAKPLRADSVEQIFFKILNEPVDVEPLREAGVPEEVRGLIAKCTAKSPAERPQSFAEVRRELRTALARLDQAAKPAEPVRLAVPSIAAWRKWLPWAVLAVGLLCIVIAFFALRPSPPVKKVELPPVLATPTGEMVLIPAGEFLAGANRQSVKLPAFYIDRTEVTNASYAQFCREKNRPLPPSFRQDRPDYPVVNITIVDAREFAKWAGQRLPTRLEWERAARGTDGRLYPWGNEYDASRSNVGKDSPGLEGCLMRVSSFPQGASSDKILNMAGNAWEFVDELITPSAGAVAAYAKILSPPPAPDEPWYTIRGGACDRPLVKNVAYEWSAVPARYREINIGFRCVKDAE